MNPTGSRISHPTHGCFSTFLCIAQQDHLSNHICHLWCFSTFLCIAQQGLAAHDGIVIRCCFPTFHLFRYKWLSTSIKALSLFWASNLGRNHHKIQAKSQFWDIWFLLHMHIKTSLTPLFTVLPKCYRCVTIEPFGYPAHIISLICLLKSCSFFAGLSRVFRGSIAGRSWV